MNLLILSLFVIPTVKPVPTPTIPVLPIDSLVEVVNQVRADNGCKIPLKINSGLIEAAEERADYVSAGNWTHEGWTKTVGKHYRYHYAGENLARHFNSDRQIVDAWLNSKTHREVMLNCQYRETGVGRNGSYVVQLFGKK
jgi:uncharacterized protein YkwD